MRMSAHKQGMSRVNGKQARELVAYPFLISFAAYEYSKQGNHVCGLSVC